ncbi:uncharacterized protein E0L32_006396 [Thyridium curvatum]|uniref:Cytokinesis regulator n=1 Tax=Thyridium curvatum TaxID=1093900 RepID=A0A507B292_9PEZI|nr:uncharacterized protein E0L32_006396 [Thyridium curvatum]TPX13196.1 hypothetical protein E0L32_006396 [Thyridium curvatum]
METLRLKPRQPVQDEVENWDDDDFMIEADELNFRNSLASSANATSHRRDSHSSFRSDLESVHGEEEKHVHLPGDDEKSTLDAIAAAENAGIPIPRNVPPSALMGGTIKRLGGRKIKKIIQEDWGEDLELPEQGQPLNIKPQDGSKFPEVLRQVSGSSTYTSPSKPSTSSPILPQEELKIVKKTPAVVPINLDRFKDDDDDDDFFGDGSATIKAPKFRSPAKPISLITPPTPQKKPDGDAEDDFEQGLELPSDGKLKLSNRREIPKTPSVNGLDDFDWGEGSLGTRFGGTRRDGRSNRSSEISALSPSIASSITAESEDEAFDGLVLPSGPLNLGERLQKRRQSRSPARAGEQSQQRSPTKQAQQQQPQVKLQQPQPQAEADRDDFLAGLDIGDGEVFNSAKLTLHRNLKIKETRPASPSRPKAAVSLTFTNKPTPVTSRLPRPMISHERSHTASSLEPVSESGGPIYNMARRSQSRLGHSAQSSISSIPTPTTPSSAQSMPPSTPRRREINQKTSAASLRPEPTTTSAQLLRLKRSLPVMRPPQSPARPATTTRGYERPPSRTDMGHRPQSSLRPKTPVERTSAGFESAAAQARRKPFLPAGSSQSQSHHIAAKSSRTFRRHDSDTIVDFRPNSRAVSRSTMRSPSPSKKHRSVERIVQENWAQLSKPRRQRHFGDGHELDGFDDLPTSQQTEARFMRQPVAAGPKAQLRNKVYQNILPDRTNTPTPLTPSTTTEHLPHFARDTTASRINREAALAQRATSNSGPLAPLTTQRVAQLSSTRNYNVPYSSVRSKKTPRKPVQLKPHLISNLNAHKEPKSMSSTHPPPTSQLQQANSNPPAQNGMYYNPETMRWEGNENALSGFDAPASSPSTASMPPNMLRERENATPRPALITPIGATKGVQVVGGMVFDAQNMCWLKVGAQGSNKSEGGDTMDGFNAIDDDDDPFKDIPDLDDNVGDSTEAGHGRVSDIKDDWLVGEEFDVGPEFIRRQREEEDRWKKKCEKWLNFEDRDRTAWAWTIRDLACAI